MDDNPDYQFQTIYPGLLMKTAISFPGAVAILLTVMLGACKPREQSPSDYQGITDQERLPLSEIYRRQDEIFSQDYSREQWEGFIDPGRDRFYKPDEVMRIIDIEPGMVVGDIGAGSGYFTFRISEKTGEQGLVYAIDTQQEGLDYIRRVISGDKQMFQNIVLVKNRYDDVLLPENTLDIGLMCELHFHSFKDLLPDNIQMIDSVYRAIKPGGKLVIIERKEKVVRTSPEIIIRNFSRAGFVFDSSHDILPQSYFLVFKKPRQ